MDYFIESRVKIHKQIVGVGVSTVQMLQDVVQSQVYHIVYPQIC